MRYFLFIWSLTVCLFGCKSGEQHPRDESDTEAVLTFGQGGGITGREIVYTLEEDGRLSKLSQTDTTTIKTISNTRANGFINEFQELTQEIPPFDKRGNIYYFISQNTNSSEVSYRWAPGKAPSQLQALYDSLQQLLE